MTDPITSLPQEIVPQTEKPAVAPPPVPVQVERVVFLAARLRELLATEANLRTLVAELQSENALFRAKQSQSEIDGLEAEFDVGEGTVLQKRPDGSVWRIPPELLQKQG
jgi:hypothetical protein